MFVGFPFENALNPSLENPEMLMNNPRVHVAFPVTFPLNTNKSLCPISFSCYFASTK